MAVEGRRFRRRKREQVFAEGSFIDHATDVNPTLDRQDETFHLYGKDSPELDVQHNFGTLAISVMDKFTNNDLLDLMTGQNPAGANPKQYKVDDLTSLHVWANIKNAKNTAYSKSWFMGGWSPGLPMPSGDPNAKATFQITGNGGLPRMFEGAWIKMAKVASGAGVNLGGDTPVLVPGEPGIYAIAVKALNVVAGVVDQEEVLVSTAMVLSTGAVNFGAIQAQLVDLPAVTHAAIYYLQTGTGIYPAAAATSDKLYD
jgi:hypothetical protein